MKIMKITSVLRPALVALLLFSAGAEAAVPRLINFQGKLSGSGGEAVTTPVSMDFNIYTAASGGAPVWTETQTVTPDASGVYSVMLGAAAPLDITFSTPYWLGVTVGADSEMLPRYRMASSPYSLNSSTAAWAEGVDWPAVTNKPDLTIQGNVFNGANQLVQLLGDGKLPVLDGSNLTGLPTAFLADGAVTTAKLANGAVTDAKAALSVAAITSGKFGDNRVAISTQALSGGIYNLAGRLVQVGADGFLPGLSGVNLTGLTKAQVGLGSADNTSDAAKPVSTAQLAALNLKASLAGAAFTGAISAPNLSGSNTGDETALSIKTALGAATALADGYLTSADWAAFNAKLAADGSGAALTGITKAQVGLGSVDNTSDAAKPVSTVQQAALNLKASLAGATFTGAIAASNLSGTNSGDETAATIKAALGAATTLTDGYLTSVDWAAFNGKLSATGSGAALTGITAAQVGLGSVDNTSDAAKPVSTAQQTALNLKANLAGAVFTGAVSAPNLSNTNTGDETAATIKAKLGAATAAADGYLTAADWSSFNGKLSPTGSGAALTGITAAQVGLGSVDNTSDAAKPVSTAQQAALDLKANLAGATFTGAISATNLSGTNAGDETSATIKTKLGAATALADGYLTSVDWALFNGKLSPAGSGAALTGITAAQVGLGSVDNTADDAKPVSTAQQTALDLKANLAGAVFTGAVSAPNLSGTNTGDQTNITGNAATVTTNADLTGVVTSVGNATSIAAGAITNTMLANGAVANLSGTNTGDQTNITGNAATVTNGVYTNLFYADPSWLTSLSPSKIDLSTVTASLTAIQVALSTAVYTSGNQTIGGVKTFSSPIAGDITGTAAKAVNIAGGSAGQLPYQTAADTTGLLAAGLAGQVLYSNGAAAPSWGTQNAGDVYKASTQTFTGLNTFTSTITAKGFANMSQSIVVNSVATFAADGSGVVLMTFNGTGSIGTITGCSSGAVAQGQTVAFVVSDWLVGGISFADTAPASAAPDTLLLDGAAGAWTPDASAVSLGSTITLLCTTVNTHKLWVEIGRSISGS